LFTNSRPFLKPIKLLIFCVAILIVPSQTNPIAAKDTIWSTLGIVSAGINIFQGIPVYVTVAVVRLRVVRVWYNAIRLGEVVNIRRTRVSKMRL
jgi:hypothetical protein